ncbi:hypothetical protein F4V91_06815 [Neorhizobium galegae]|uniref:Uncharacterized protein n=1 Tax=Neorhizobium galegae TaxID=399 RepID=A0A6A1TPR6_NEOGA|nr:hypothetical protein [Neorhizobium galegae]KAB1086170.1 hypothetical protein F4V91_06815 [Neorhizobium galegae]
MKRILITGCLIVACASVSSAQTLQDYSGSYLCKLAASAGLRLNAQSQTWNGVTFDVTNSSVLMKITNTNKTGSSQIYPEFGKYSVAFKDFGSTGKAQDCVSNYASAKFTSEVPIIEGRLECNFFATTYRVNLQTNRIQITFDGGYMDDWKENQDTPYIAVGVCDKVS